MIRYVIVTATETTVQAKVDGEVVDTVRPAGHVLRNGYCTEDLFNRQAVESGSVAIEIDPADWPVNDVTHRIDFSGEEPTIVLKSG